MGWGIQHRLRQKQAIGHHHTYVSVQIVDALLHLLGAQGFGVVHLKPQLKRAGVHRCGAVFLATACGAGRLTEDSGDVMAGLDQCIEHRDRKLRGAHKKNAHDLSPA